MQCSFSRRLALCLLLGLAVSWLPQALGAEEADKDDKAEKAADKDKPKTDEGEKVKFTTGDDVELVGMFYPSSKKKKAPCVMLLHQLGSDITQDGWDRLALELQKSGYSVLAFDFRGHGKSTEVNTKFWSRAANQQGIKTYSAARPKTSISQKDFRPEYFYRLVDDIAAAKLFLDKKNDSDECNSASVIVIGAEEGATLGTMWMATEFNRHRLTNPLPIPANVDPRTEGKSLTCAVWLTISPKIRNQTASGLSEWIKTVGGKENKVPMFFLYGEKDQPGETFAKHCEGDVKKGKTDKDFPLTGMKKIAETKLTGVGLLGKSLDTTELITKYLDKVIKEKGAGEWEKREVDRTGYVWTFGTRLTLAKREGEKSLYPLPLNQFMGP